jgi:ubiquinone/menaquinone biosynthesis C-methylase UbiE/uncharacterized protein YbaR (Trm112 family)
MTQCGFSRLAVGAVHCPKDGGVLLVDREESGNDAVIFEGVLNCQTCNQKYFIRGGILDLFNLEELPAILRVEVGARDAAAELYDIRLASRYEKEIPSTLAQFPKIKGAKIIEYGCGTGRLTEYLSGASLVVACDFSRSSLEVLLQKFSNSSNIAAVLSDAALLRTSDEFFDWALSTQVLEHIPAPHRRLFLHSIKRTLIPSGVFISTSYYFDLRRRLKKRPQEGNHGSGIFYHYFSRRELVNEMSQMFEVEKSKIIDIALPLEARLPFSAKFRGFLSRVVERFPILRQFGHLILVKARKGGAGLHYFYGLTGNRGFIKHWFWFRDPEDVRDAAMVNFFSYNKVEREGFHRREGLTTVIDLSPSLTELWERARPNFIRKQIGKGERKGIVVKKNDDFRAFKKMYKNFRRDKGLARDNFRAIKNCTDLFCAYHNGEMLAGGIFVSDGKSMRALILASRYTSQRDLRELVGQANRLLVWEVIKFAKESGHKVFDLGGISPESSKPELRTLAEFKEAWGGQRRPNFYYFKVYSRLLRWWMRWRGFKHV